MSKSNKVLNLKDKISDNEMDLSLCNLTEVPFKELALFTKATILDLSCNNLPSLPPEFCNLTHLVKLDLSKNQLTRLPDDLGNLTGLQHLDLYNNKLSTLPVSFSQLRSLKWLDLKDNPLDAGLAKAAGDCLDEKQCKQCATRNILHTMEAQRIRGQFAVKGPERMVLKHMQILQDEADRAREKRLLREKELEKKREAKKREREAREKEARKREKAEEKEKRRKEYNAQVAAAAAVIQEQKQQQQQKKTEERKSKKKNGQASAGKKSGAVAASKPCRSVLGLLFKLSLLLFLGAAVMIATCRLTELKREDVCVSVDAALDQSLTWARKQEGVVRHLLGDLSAAVKDFLESMQTSKS